MPIPAYHQPLSRQSPPKHHQAKSSSNDQQDQRTENVGVPHHAQGVSRPVDESKDEGLERRSDDEEEFEEKVVGQYSDGDEENDGEDRAEAWIGVGRANEMVYVHDSGEVLSCRELEYG